MVDVGAILRTIEKSEDFEIPEVSRYLQVYRKFSELVSSIIKDLTTTDEVDLDKVNTNIAKVEAVYDLTDSVYEVLVSNVLNFLPINSQFSNW